MPFAPTTIIANGVNDAYWRGLDIIASDSARREDSRNGAVTIAPGPVTTFTMDPLRRVLFSPLRDANPFFHFFESLWMLAGRNDLPWLTQFNKRMASFSDDGGNTQPAAYGHRWRAHFGYDQLELIIEELRRNPLTRRCVLAMWDSGSNEWGDVTGDLSAAIAGSNDVPCNTHCYFTIADGRLHMGVMCRSNDVVWGAHGANAVHFSILLEYVAARAGVAVGTLTQFSWNYHLYDGVLKADIGSAARDAQAHDYYTTDGMDVTRLFYGDDATLPQFYCELDEFMDWANHDNVKRKAPSFSMPVLRDIAVPMRLVWDLHKMGDYRLAINTSYDICGADWRTACREWLGRRAARRQRNT